MKQPHTPAVHKKDKTQGSAIIFILPKIISTSVRIDPSLYQMNGTASH
jgi:hypothetical protein